MTQATGRVDAGFEGVAEAFARVLADQPGAGAAVAIRHEGRLVVDLWGGAANAAVGRDWRQDTPSVIFSATKGLMAVLAARLRATGDLDYLAPVAEYWPEFAQNGKAAVLVRDVLSHRGGLPAFEVPISIEDLQHWDVMVDRLAAQAPLWAPGTMHAYHPLTYGWLIGEVLHRITGLMPGALLEQQIAGPLGVDAWIGVSQEVSDRVAELQDPPELPPQPDEVPEWVRRTAMGAASSADIANLPSVRAAQIPAAGGIATAAALATIWSSTVVTTKSVRTLDDDTVEEATRVQSEGPQADGSSPPYARWGMGFQLDSDARHYLTPSSFGHDGFGGQVTFADPAHRIGFAFITNRMLEVDDHRATALVDALREALSQ